MAWETTLYETIDDGQIVKITMNRPEKRNAMDQQLKEELFEAFQMADQDDDVRVIILAGAGSSWSSGHDLGATARPSQHPIMKTRLQGIEGQLRREEHIYTGINRYIRSVNKPVIAMIQGHCMAGAIQVASMCDIIIASEGTIFQNQVPRMTPAGAELLVEPWEMGVRKAREFLFTGDPIDAQAALQLGMVNKVVPLDKLEAETLIMARKIALMPVATISLLKRSLNRAQDLMGQADAYEYHLLIHEISHFTAEASKFMEELQSLRKEGGVRAYLAKRDAGFNKLDREK